MEDSDIFIIFKDDLESQNNSHYYKQLQSETPLPLYDEEHINAGLMNGDQNNGTNTGAITNGVPNGLSVSHMEEWNSAPDTSSRMLDDINKALTSPKNPTKIEDEPTYAQVKIKRNLTMSK